MQVAAGDIPAGLVGRLYKEDAVIPVEEEHAGGGAGLGHDLVGLGVTHGADCRRAAATRDDLEPLRDACQQVAGFGALLWAAWAELT